MFENNYQELKNILENIGINYTDDIFDNTKYTNIHCTKVQLVTTKPANTEHEVYRTWQINQPFMLNNNTIDLLESQKQEMINPDILSVYPEVATFQ